jgi:tetratricopeptide (TPR) repeat protein
MICVLAFLAIASPVRANKARAAELYKKGMSAYAVEQYDEAIAEFEEAFKEEPAPGLLYNIAQAHRQAHRSAKAIVFYRRYLELEPAAADRAEVERLIQELESASPIGESDRVSVGQSAAGAPFTQPPPPAAKPSPRRRWWPIAVGVGGGLLLAAGAITVAVVATRPGEYMLPVESLR